MSLTRVVSVSRRPFNEDKAGEVAFNLPCHFNQFHSALTPLQNGFFTAKHVIPSPHSRVLLKNELSQLHMLLLPLYHQDGIVKRE